MTANDYLLLLVAIVLGLLALAIFLPSRFLPSRFFNPKHSNENTKQETDDSTHASPKKQSSKHLQALHKKVSEQLTASRFQASLSEKYITISHQGKKYALITLDPKLDTHTRQLGDVQIINFKKPPSDTTLETALKQAKILSVH